MSTQLIERFRELVEHHGNYSCAAHSEGQYCCLDIDNPEGYYEKILAFIESEIANARKEMKEKCIDSIDSLEYRITRNSIKESIQSLN